DSSVTGVQTCALPILIVPALFTLLDLEVEDPGWAALDGPERRQRTIGAITRVLLRVSERTPIIVVFEDLHWIDSETQAVLDDLVVHLPAARMLLLVNFRPEYVSAWRGRTHVTEIMLDPFDGSSTAHLVAYLVGRHASLEE